MLLGDAAMEILLQSRVAVFGLGGVGGYVVEALARSGIGSLDLIDNDTVCLSNLNRQIIAAHSTVGLYKTEAAAKRIADIAPACTVRTNTCFYLPETADVFDFTLYDYIVDAIDTVSGKISLVLNAQNAGTPIISSLGTGNKLDPSRLKIGDLYETSVCPLARVMRRELRRRGVERLKVLWSDEEPLTPLPSEEPSERRATPGSTAFVPPAGGLLIAAEVVKDLIDQGNPSQRFAREKPKAIPHAPPTI